MSNVLDFTTRKKPYLTVKLADEKNTVLMVGSPTKGVLDEFIAINESITDNDGADAEALNDLYRICAKIMSFNKGGIEITPDYLATFFDVDDITYFIKGYSSFISSITNSKN
jgi:hypothetical protein